MIKVQWCHPKFLLTSRPARSSLDQSWQWSCASGCHFEAAMGWQHPASVLVLTTESAARLGQGGGEGKGWMVTGWQRFCSLSIPSGHLLPMLPMPGAAGATAMDWIWPRWTRPLASHRQGQVPSTEPNPGSTLAPNSSSGCSGLAAFPSLGTASVDAGVSISAPAGYERSNTKLHITLWGGGDFLGVVQ